MILAVTLNAALDVTYEIGELERGGSHRVQTVRERAGGKGINVARVAHALGCEVTATGLAGGAVGELIRDDLHRSEVNHDLVSVSGTSRRTLTVVETGSGEATVLNEAGPHVRPEEWQAFLRHFDALAASASIVVLSGSLPPGVPSDAYAELVRRTPGQVVLDADGTALAEGVRGRPDVVKPNADELARATAGTGGERHPAERAREHRGGGVGRAEELWGDEVRGVVGRAQELRAAGGGAVLVSLGAGGMVAVTSEGVWRAVPPGAVVGNPTGAGDAAVAATARALMLGRPWDELLRDAVALSAAAVAAPVAGDFDPDLYARLLPEIAIEGFSCPS
ncbi:1-phosphofructokinase family hexose kinase [Actinomadura oligospora]|uniref:1-phosphofructokinase family hexose kinase n=1 Tax=Actinomadura oligospora TaxID=111804 RepID=UPI00047DE1B1|nr:hexose kinase [Actinomadura oligospora]